MFNDSKSEWTDPRQEQAGVVLHGSEPARVQRHRSSGDTALEGLIGTARELHPTNFSGYLRRRSLLKALLLAAVASTFSRLMDLLIFGVIPDNAPAFFVVIAAMLLVVALPAVCVRRLRDSGANPRLTLLLLLPVLGWLMLAWLLSRPSRRRSRESA